MNDVLVILLVGCMVAASCALVGTFLVLRKMALLGDAISHSVLPGIAIGFLLTQSRTGLAMVLGAGALGVLTVFLVERLQRTGLMYEDASIGVVFPALFAVGVILVSRYASMIDLDLDCVLYGEIAYAPWDLVVVAGRTIGPRAVWVNGLTLLLNLVVIGLFFKELKLVSFDPGLCEALGYRPVRLHYLLMALVSITVVAAFESVGAILVVAMLVVPPCAAYLLVDRLALMAGIAVVIGCAAVFAGYGLARLVDGSIAGGMAVAAGGLFILAFLFSPKYGLVATRFRRSRAWTRPAEPPS